MHFHLTSFFAEKRLTERITREFVGLLLEKLFRTGVGFFVLSSVARHLGSDNFGELNFGLALGAMGAGVATVGTDALIVRESVRHPRGVPEILGTVAILRTIAGLMISLGLILFFWISGIVAGNLMVMVLLVATTFAAVTTIPTVWFQSQSLSRVPAWAAFCVFLVASVWRLYLVETKAPLVAFAWVAFVELCLVGLATGWLLQRRGVGISTWRGSRQLAVRLLREAWPLWVAGIAVIAYMRVDQIVLRILAGPKETGIYSAALRISEQGYLIPMTLAAPMLSALSAYSRDTTLQTQLLRRYFSASVVAAYFFALAVWLTAPSIFRIFFGSEYSESIRVIQIHVLGAPFVFLGVARSQVLVTLGMMQFAMWSTVVGATVNLVLNLLLTTKFGAVGAAWSSVGAQIVAAWISTWVYAPTRQLAREQTAALLFPWVTFRTRTHEN